MLLQVLSIADREELDRYAPIPKLHVDKYSTAAPSEAILKVACELSPAGEIDIGDHLLCS